MGNTRSKKSKHQSVEMESDRVRTELPYIMPNEDDDFPIWLRRDDIVTNNIRTSDVPHEEILRESVLHNHNPDAGHPYDVIAEARLYDIIGKEGPSNTAAANRRPKLPLPWSVCRGQIPQTLELASCDTSHTNERTVARLRQLDSFQNVYLNYPYSVFGDGLNRNLSKTSLSAMYGSPDDENEEIEYTEWSQTNRECRGYNNYEAYATQEETIHYNNHNTESINKPSVDQWNKIVIPRKSLAHVMVNPICGILFCSDNPTPGNNLHMSSEEDSCLRDKIQTDAHKDTEDNTETKQYSSTQRKLHRYEEAAILFRNLIVNTVVVRQILPHLHACLDLPDIEHLRQLSSHNNREAAEKLLDLIHSSPEPGKWKMLVEALERSGNKLLVEIMRQSVVEDNDEQIKVFNMVTPKLREMICPSELIPFLRNADIINGDDAEEIIAKEKHYGCIAAADILLQCIPKKHPKWFDLLLSAFVSAGRLDLKEILEFGIANETRDETITALTVVSFSRNESRQSPASLTDSKKKSSRSEDEIGKETSNKDVANVIHVDVLSKPLLPLLPMCLHQGAETELGKTHEAEDILDIIPNKTELEISEKCDGETELGMIPKAEEVFVVGHMKTISKVSDKSACNDGWEYSQPYEERITKCSSPGYSNENTTGQEENRINNDNVNTCNSALVTRTDTDHARDQITKCCEKIPVKSTNESITELRQLKNDTRAKIKLLELENQEYMEINEDFDRMNELLRANRDFREQLTIKRKMEAALKAAISKDTFCDPGNTDRCAACLGESALYTAPRRNSHRMTVEYRDNDKCSFNIDKPCYLQLENDTVVKIFDVNSTYKDSAFYSTGSYNGYTFED